ncbi:MAG: reductive dehalogenase [Chromatiales bacterium]|jgi:epoxyqueuosine reductase|nr:reductive dehalogenase [Chromatiales bacterium]
MPWPSNSPDDSDTAASLEQWQERFADTDALAGIEMGEGFERFSQMNDVFTRAFWDDTVRTKDSDAFFASYRIEAAPRRGDGFNHKDFALRNAAWSISDMVSERNAADGEREGFQAPIRDATPVFSEPLVIEDIGAFTVELKHIAKLFGADLVGITEVDERWHYSARVDTRTFSPTDNALPADISHVIVLGHSMDHELVRTYPSALAGASTGLEYSHEAAIVIQLSTYIRNLGYQAVGSMNDTALVIPYAIKAGLGEYGRNQMVITPEFGPRIRFSKIFTSLPLKVDKPKPLGIRQYCSICTVCADACPPKALPFGRPSFDKPNQSTLGGIKKWSADCEKCFGYWAKLKSDCAICMRVCPFNRDYSKWTSRLFYAVATSSWRAVARWWMSRVGVAKRLKPCDWWAALTAR